MIPQNEGLLEAEMRDRREKMNAQIDRILPVDGTGHGIEGAWIQSDGGGLQFIEGHGVPTDG
jgi:hypothetical protein